MIKLEHVVLASPEQMEFIIEGMRNPHNSWQKSDSGKCTMEGTYVCDNCNRVGDFCLGPNDHSLMQKLVNAGTDHRKFMRMMPVYVRITAPLYWWKEFDTYKIGSVANSCSTMHKIQEKEFTLEDFSCEHLIGEPYDIDNDDPIDGEFNDTGLVLVANDDNGWLGHCYHTASGNKCVEYLSPKTLLERYIISALNANREAYLKTKDKKYWWQMIQLLPSSYNQTRNVMLNYEVLANIYKSRKAHKLDEWQELCSWIETLPYAELICGNDALMTPNEQREKMGMKRLNEPEFMERINKAIENYGKTDEINDIVDKIIAIGRPNPLSSEELKTLLSKED